VLGVRNLGCWGCRIMARPRTDSAGDAKSSPPNGYMDNPNPIMSTSGDVLKMRMNKIH